MSQNGMTYEEFLRGKRLSAEAVGFEIQDSDVHPLLFPFQRDIVRWAVRKGRAAVFSDCGTGKTLIQLSVADIVHRSTGADVLILAPLAVSAQTQREARKIDVPVTVCRDASDIRPGINITNYERLHHFDPAAFGCIILDESSILKGFDGVTRRRLNEFSERILYRLACTATPAPNDLVEIVNHAEFLGVMDENEVKALFFTQDGNTTTKWRLKGHAQNEFWKWMASWCVALTKPSDLCDESGHPYSDAGFDLPPLMIEMARVDFEWQPDGYLFPVRALTLQEQRESRRDSLSDRVRACADKVNDSDEPWIVWCELNSESEALTKAINGAVEVKGSDSPEHKESAMLGFADGSIRVLVSKPSICGFGMNFQHCCKMAFVGVGHSYEQFYQAVRRVWRFGQQRTVQVWLFATDADGAVVANLRRKESQARNMMTNIVKHMRMFSMDRQARQEMHYERETASGKDWTLDLGDCVEITDDVEPESVGLSVFSPPFPGMYTYTNSVRDMGNVKDIQEMIQQFRFLSAKLLRALMPGRTCAIHLTQINAQKARDGYIGLKDFRGETIRMMEEEGWIYYGEVCIDKNPQVKAIRTKDRGLLFKTLAKDSAHMHMAMADYLLQFRKPGDNPAPIRSGVSKRYKNEGGWITSEEWIRWARPVWYAADWTPDSEIIMVQNEDGSWTPQYRSGEWDAIAETDVLNVRQARETNDERHLAPLQLGLIERVIKLWSNPGDLVYSPFAGIGSEGYKAVELERRFRGAELKRSYWQSAISNLSLAERQKQQTDLFAGVEEQAA